MLFRNYMRRRVVEGWPQADTVLEDGEEYGLQDVSDSLFSRPRPRTRNPYCVDQSCGYRCDAYHGYFARGLTLLKPPVSPKVEIGRLPSTGSQCGWLYVRKLPFLEVQDSSYHALILCTTQAVPTGYDRKLYPSHS